MHNQIAIARPKSRGRSTDDRAVFQRLAVRMARAQAHHLLHNSANLPAATVVADAVALIMDAVRHLDLPALAVEVALGVHPIVERWAAWGRWADALDALLALDDHAYSLADRIHVLHCRNHAACELGDHATATATAETALQLAEALGDQHVIALSLQELGLTAYFREDVSSASAYWERAYTLGAAHLPPVKLGHIAMNLGLVAVAQGRFAEAHRYYDQACVHYRTAGDAMNLANLQYNVGSLWRHEERLEDALTTFEDACQMFYDLGARHAYGDAQNEVGYTNLTLRRFDQAVAAFQAAIQAFDEVGSLSSKALVLSNLAELYVTTEQWQQAEHTLAEARELAVVCGKSLLVAAIDVDLGRMLAAHGDHTSARMVWEGALAVQEAKGALHAAQHTRELIAALPMNEE